MPFPSILVLIGAIQGFICFALLAFSKKGDITANRILGSILMLLSLACLNLYLLHTGIQNKSYAWRVFADCVPLVVATPIGPLLVLYTRRLSGREEWGMHGKRILLISFLPDLIPYLVGVAMHIAFATRAIDEMGAAYWRIWIGEYQVYSDIVRWMSGSVGVLLMLRMLRLVGQPSQKTWLRQVTWVFAVFQLVWLVHLVPYIIPTTRELLISTVDWYPLYIPLSVLVYWLGINGYLRLFAAAEKEKSKSNLAHLPKTIIDLTVRGLVHAMEVDQLFLNPHLNVDGLAKHIGVAPKTVSAVLNQHLEKSFNDFVNAYRVDEMKRRLIGPENQSLTITGHALESGFNSQATMQRSFRALTGKSPREFQQQVLSGVSDLKNA